MSRKAFFRAGWVLMTLAAVGVALLWMTVGGARRIFLIGETTAAHHQIELACESCHTAPVFAAAATAEQALNKACRNCHEDELAEADDSHPRKMFRNPRMAVYWDKLDARLCTTCHA